MPSSVYPYRNFYSSQLWKNTMFRFVNPLTFLKRFFGILGGRTYRTAGRQHPVVHLLRRQVHLAVDQLEARETPSATEVATSFFDSAIYEFDSGTGALKTTLVAPNSSTP